MVKENTSPGSSSESEFEETEKLSDEEKNVKKISDYEKQRLSRIAENKARMEALGLHKMASSLGSSVQKTVKNRKISQRKGKSKVVDDYDEDYRPNNDDDDDERDDDDFDDKDDDEDEDFVRNSSSKSRKNKVKRGVSKPKKKFLSELHFGSADNIGEEDDELMQAIALSLQDSAKVATLKERKENNNIQEDSGTKKRKKPLSNRAQMTEDDLVLYFFQFDEQGSGYLTVRDLQRLATAHDFTWTDRELDEMIHYFDSDRDGRLSLDDFGKIASRCNMIQRSEKS
ncbi:NAD-dependent protein deacetylase HST1-like [Mercurialis annua]|uniref:NAD-dependent protein deacetylase HST1-like n=1 Tax=Mercurialis annua TaxID=3986 RepID=UPI00215EB4EA|nr:NAD-dependent protein deacetylase HST1-like [Mercurialis annua]